MNFNDIDNNSSSKLFLISWNTVSPGGGSVCLPFNLLSANCDWIVCLSICFYSFYVSYKISWFQWD